MLKARSQTLMGCFWVVVMSVGAGAAPPEVGKPVPDFSVVPVGGDSTKPLTLADFKGKTLVLEFWATWCGPCHMAREELTELHQALKDRGVVILSVTDEPPDKVTKFTTKHPVPYQLATDVTNKTQSAYGVNGIPISFVIDRDGKLAFLAGAPTKRMMLRYLDEGAIPWQSPTSQPARLPGRQVLILEISQSRVKPGRGSPVIGKQLGNDNYGLTTEGSSLPGILANLLDVSKVRLLCDDGIPDVLWDIKFYHIPVNGTKPDVQIAVDALCREAGVRFTPAMEEREVWVATHSGDEPPPGEGYNQRWDVDTRAMTYAGYAVADILQRHEGQAGIPIVDETHLNGQYRVVLPAGRETTFEDIRKALHDKYGISLDKARRKVQMYHLTPAKAATSQPS